MQKIRFVTSLLQKTGKWMNFQNLFRESQIFGLVFSLKFLKTCNQIIKMKYQRKRFVKIKMLYQFFHFFIFRTKQASDRFIGSTVYPIKGFVK